MNILTALAQHPPARIALQDPQQVVTYRDLPGRIDERARQLAGIACAGLALDNGVEWVLWDLAALKAGTVLVPLPPFFTQAQTQHALQSSGCAALISATGVSPLPFAPVSLPEGTAKITYTSGTTGTPKGVCLPWTAMENVAQSIVSTLGPDLAGIHCSVLPLGVLLENVAGVYAGLLAGATIILPALGDFGPQYSFLHAQLKQTRATSAIVVPEILRSLMAQLVRLGPLDDLKFIAVGGSKVDPGLVLRARMSGLPVYEGYGLSECASVVSLNAPGHDKPGTTGRVLPHVETKIENGEIVIRNPGFLGYVGADHHGPYPTGDLGTIDPEGFLCVTGRKKNVLITSYGRNVSPEWVESVLLAQPDIAQAFVYGDAQPHLSALIVPARADADIDGAVERANTELPDYARIGHAIPTAPFTPQDGTLTGNGRLRRQNILATRTAPEPRRRTS